MLKLNVEISADCTCGLILAFSIDFDKAFDNIGPKSPFLARVSILTRDIDIGILSVRPSVRLSVRP